MAKKYGWFLAITIAVALLGVAASFWIFGDASPQVRGSWIHDSSAFYSEVFFDGSGSMTRTYRNGNGGLSTWVGGYELKNGTLYTFSFDGKHTGTSRCILVNDSLLIDRYVYTRK